MQYKLKRSDGGFITTTFAPENFIGQIINNNNANLKKGWFVDIEINFDIEPRNGILFTLEKLQYNNVQYDYGRFVWDTEKFTEPPLTAYIEFSVNVEMFINDILTTTLKIAGTGGYFLENPKIKKYLRLSIFATNEKIYNFRQTDMVDFETFNRGDFYFYVSPDTTWQPLEFYDITDNPIGGDSTTGGGDGTYDDSSDTIPDPVLPNFNVSDTNFLSLYQCSNATLRLLYTYINTPDFINAINPLRNAPIDALIGANYFPIDVTATEGRIDNIVLGNVDTGISTFVITSQYVDIDCGTLDIQPYFGTYVDYSPNTKLSIFLPFIGDVPLEIDHFMRGSITVKYRIDLLTGSALCTIRAKRDNLDAILYHFNTIVSSAMPITGTDYRQVISAIFAMVVGVVGGGIAGGAIASGIAGAGATGAMGASAYGLATLEGATNAGALMSAGGAIAGGLTSATGNIGVKPNIVKSNQIGGASGYMGNLIPYLTFTRPKPHRPQNFENYNGYLSLITYKLSELVGYTIVKDIHLTGINATTQELLLIEKILKQGVIL